MKKYYVNAASSSAANPDGSSWLKAFNKLQPAVDAAAAAGGGEVWVAAGTYTATTDPVLTMKEGVFLYGGFVGNESLLEERDWQGNVTTIDGEKKRRCVIGADNARLDGFTIARGFATEYGGGMYNYESSPEVTDCTFTENTASYDGGGMYNYKSSPSVTNCTFTGNTSWWRGGGMYNYESSPEVTDCTFTNNTASSDGAGMYNDESSPAVTNCIL